MPPIIPLSRGGQVKNGKTLYQTLRGLAEGQARLRISSIAQLTGSFGGTASTTISRASEVLTNVAATGSNLADKTTSEQGYTAVLSALGELYAKANSLASSIGLDQVVNSGGGDTPDGVMNTIGISPASAATGIQATQTNAMHLALNNSFYRLSLLVNRLGLATRNTNQGQNFVPFVAGYVTPNNIPSYTSVPAISINGGTPASPGVLQSDVVAALTLFRSNANLIAAKLATIQTNTGGIVVAVS